MHNVLQELSASVSRDGRRKRLTCNVENCSKSTREAKPYCLIHVDKLPYIQKLWEQQSALEKEIEKVKKRGMWGISYPNSPIVKEILAPLKVENFFVGDLKKQVDSFLPGEGQASPLDFETFKIYIKHMETCGWIALIPRGKSFEICLENENPPIRDQASKQIAKELKIRANTVTGWAAKQGAPHRVVTHRKGSRYYFNLDEIAEWYSATIRKSCNCSDTNLRNPPQREQTSAQIASAMGAKSGNTVIDWAKKGAPHTHLGHEYRFDLLETQTWYERFIRKNYSGVESPSEKGPVRDRTSAQIAKSMKMKTSSIRNWVRMGAPHRFVDAIIHRSPRFYFNLKEVKAWYQARKEEGYRSKRGNFTIPDNRWEMAVALLKQGGSVRVVAKKTGISQKSITNRIQKYDIDTDQIDLSKNRTLDYVQLAETLKISVETVKKYTRLGLPHDSVKAITHPKLLFNADEARKWAKGYKKESSKKRSKALSSHHSKRLTDDFWALFDQDYLANMLWDDLIKKHKVSDPVARRHLRDAKLSRERLKPRKRKKAKVA